MDIDQVEIGRETDALVAEVMGLVWHYGKLDGKKLGLPYYSTDIKESWEADKPEWEWQFVESPGWLAVYLWYMAGNPPLDTNQPLVVVRIDWGEVGTKAEAYALGRCRAILKFSQCQSSL